MAAPVVGRMMADILPYMGVEAEYDEQRGDTVMPLVIDMPLDKAVGAIHDAGLTYRTIGQGDVVTDQLPLSGTMIASDSQIILYLGESPSEGLEVMPDLSGMSYAQARDMLSYYGMYIRTSSVVSNAEKQTVCSQSISAGTMTQHGTAVEVSLVSRDEDMLGRY